MNEFTAWIQSNWYELGNLFAEFVFLAVGIWFARKVLRTLRASQEQVGALLKLSLTGAVPERNSSNTAAERSFASGSPYWLTPSEVPSAGQPMPSDSDPSQLPVARHGSGLVVHKPCGVGEVDLAAGTDHFESAEAVQNRLDFAKVTFGQHQQKIVAGQAHREIGAATRPLQTPGQLFQSLVRSR